jgi:hypothetical protein
MASSKGTDAAPAPKPMRWLLVLGMFSIQLTNVRRAERGIALPCLACVCANSAIASRGVDPAGAEGVLLFVVCASKTRASMHAPHYREWLACLNDLQVQCSFSPLVRFQVGYTIVAKLALGKKGKEVRLRGTLHAYALSTVTCVRATNAHRLDQARACTRPRWRVANHPTIDSVSLTLRSRKGGPDRELCLSV